MGKAQVFGDNMEFLVKKCEQWADNFNAVHEPRDEFIKNTLKHFQTALPDYNVCVLNTLWKHNVTINNGVRVHVELPRFLFGTQGFDVYIFK
uniref:Uncharacterized protein n=1 Tax=Panagrolaimus sp. JU765 TaxID=591449 RepID=A0AC34RS97_9BILA